jgi:uncharacterized membrane protein
MPDATTRRRRSRPATPKAADVPSGPDDAVDEVEEQADGGDMRDDAADRGDDGGGDRRTTLTGELRDTIRDTAIEILKPVARNATKAATKAAITKGPGLVKDKVGPMVSEAGGPGELAKNAMSKGGGLVGGVTDKLPGGGDKKGGKKPTGHGRGRRLPVQEFVDVAVPIDVAYDQFTQFEEFPKFMHRVEKIEQRDDSTLMWHENIWGVRRQWEAEILEQQPCERIVWKSSGGPQTVGVVTFHALSDQLTRVYVNLDFQPQGLFEKTASGMRLSRRALRSDLMRFKAFTEMRNEPTGAWRGLIEDGEVQDEEQGDEQEAEGRGDEKRGRDQGRRRRFSREASDEEEPEAESDEDEDEEELDEEPVAEEDEWADEDEEPDDAEDEPEERPAPKRRSRKKAAATSKRR